MAFTINANTTDRKGALSAFFHAVPRSPCNSITPNDHIASSVPTLNTNSTATASAPKSDSLSGIGTKPKLNTPIVMAYVRALGPVSPVAYRRIIQPIAMPIAIEKKPTTGGSHTFSGWRIASLPLILLKARQGSSTFIATFIRLSSASRVSQLIRRKW